jgi:coenzyme F420-0:L-glutamate ligase/coenzyme F420-1:gamma-L-glutamate ligase
MRKLNIFAIEGLPNVGASTDVADVIVKGLADNGLRFIDGDIVVIAQKIISKAEGRLVDLTTITPSPRARELAAVTGKEPRLVELNLLESSSILRAAPNTLIVRHRLGHVMANAGIDRSNIETANDNEDLVLLLPQDPDLSASVLRDRLQAAASVRLGVIISDSFGRAWRLGTIGIAIGVAGPPALHDRRGDIDLFGRELRTTQVGFADAVAAAAVLVMGEGNEGYPVVVVRGCSWEESGQNIRDVIRPAAQDLFT